MRYRDTHTNNDLAMELNDIQVYKTHCVFMCIDIDIGVFVSVLSRVTLTKTVRH